MKITPNYLHLAYQMKLAADQLVKAGAVHFEVEGNPIPKARPVTRFLDGQPVRTFTPRRTQDYEARVAWAARGAMRGRDPLQGPVAVVMHFYRKDCRVVDFDNLAKAVLDAVQETDDNPGGILLADDDQVVEAHIYKSVDPDRPRVEVWAWEINTQTEGENPNP